VKRTSEAHTPKANGRSRHESDADRKVRARAILRRLKREFPGATTALSHEDPFQLLIATILSAQCTDERVNMVTKDLFKKYKNAAAFAHANITELEQDIRSTGFYRMKSRNIVGCCKALLDRHKGKVPPTLDDLVALPGVGRKTANVVLGQAFGIVSGIVVDTHVQRLSRRMGFSSEESPEKIETELMSLFPKQSWIDVGSVFILHGRACCNARKPKCLECPVAELCPFPLASSLA
jgi:endonuclease-3